MAKSVSKLNSILDCAEKMARTGGYKGFSFREIAKEVGIKSASVHYHFPSKDDLGAAIARRYTERFIESVGAADNSDTPPNVLLERYVDAFRGSLVDDGLMCLCGMFGAEIHDLPSPVVDETRHFFETNLTWLRTVFGRLHKTSPDSDDNRCAALHMLAVLEGAMIIARTLNDMEAFDAIVQKLLLGLLDTSA
jgi:TetR/AcrR family transcriptional regulator, transcriptional repressor for nem operon